MSKSPEQTTSWVAGNISKMREVRAITLLGPNTILITRKKSDPFGAGIISVPVVTAEVLQPLLDSNSQIEIVANVPRESAWTGDAIATAGTRGVAFGGISDLMSAISLENVREYVRREFEFVERGLNQH